MPYKLRHKESGLYWKGGGQPFLEKFKLNPLAWSKNGKSWNQKGHLSSAISPHLEGKYIRGTMIKDFSKAEENYEMSLRFFESSFPKYEKLISNLVRRMKMKLELL